MIKHCPKCKKDLELNKFSVNSSRYDGLQAACTDCMRAYRRAHYRSDKQRYIDRATAQRKECSQYLADLKSKSACADCGVQYPTRPYLMEFDHISGDKVHNVGNLVSYGMTALKKEIQKCEIVCAICHRIRTHTRLGK